MPKYFPLILLLFIGCVQCRNNTNVNINLSDAPIAEDAVVAYNSEKMIGAALDVQSLREREYGMPFEFETIDSIYCKVKDEDAVILLQKIKDWADYGNFHHVVIRYRGDQCRYLNVNGWTTPNAYMANLSDFGQYDANNTKAVYVQEASDNDWLLFLFGAKSSDCPPLLTVVNMTRFEKPELIFNDCGMLCDFTDWNNDGAKDLEVSAYLDNADTDSSYEQTFRRYYLVNGYYTMNLNDTEL